MNLLQDLGLPDKKGIFIKNLEIQLVHKHTFLYKRVSENSVFIFFQ